MGYLSLYLRSNLTRVNFFLLIMNRLFLKIYCRKNPNLQGGHRRLHTNVRNYWKSGQGLNLKTLIIFDNQELERGDYPYKSSEEVFHELSSRILMKIWDALAVWISVMARLLGPKFWISQVRLIDRLKKKRWFSIVCWTIWVEVIRSNSPWGRLPSKKVFKWWFLKSGYPESSLYY